MATPTTLPSTFAASSVLTSTQMNDLRGAFRVLQVVSTTKTDTFTTTSSTFANITGLTATITPSSIDSKILIYATLVGGDNTGSTVFFRLRRGSTDIAIGDAAGSRVRLTGSFYSTNAATAASVALSHLDSPATTSATTYAIHMASQANGTATYINRTDTDTDNANFWRSVSTITVMEISA